MWCERRVTVRQFAAHKRCRSGLPDWLHELQLPRDRSMMKKTARQGQFVVLVIGDIQKDKMKTRRGAVRLAT